MPVGAEATNAVTVGRFDQLSHGADESRSLMVYMSTKAIEIEHIHTTSAFGSFCATQRFRLIGTIRVSESNEHFVG